MDEGQEVDSVCTGMAANVPTKWRFGAMLAAQAVRTF